jgi:hypothetical protein
MSLLQNITNLRLHVLIDAGLDLSAGKVIPVSVLVGRKNITQAGKVQGPK